MMQNILMAVFSGLMIANFIALVRFWRMTVLMNFTLKNFIESNRQFAEMLDKKYDGDVPPLQGSG